MRMPIGRSVYLWRTERRLTQSQLSRAAGIPRPGLSDLERGKRELSLKTLRRLASALRVTPGTLVDGVSPLVLAGPLAFSRNDLDRIADAVLGARKPAGRRGQVVEWLQTLSGSRIASAAGEQRKGRRSGKRRVSAAWLQLKASLSDETARALLQRIEDREPWRRKPDEISGGR